VPTAKRDAIVADAVETARAAAIAASSEAEVGDHLGVTVEDTRVATHAFVCLHPGYVGWHWAVTMTRAARSKEATVSEVVLLPGDGALLAPPWVPWSKRIQPGDMAAGMVMPTSDDDPRLEPGYEAGSGDLSPDEAIEIRAVVGELGLGRQRVLSREGHDVAMERWLDGPAGTDNPETRSAIATCASCGYHIRLRGSLGACFGVCANEYSPRDGHVVSVDHGCGAHSDVPDPHVTAPVSQPVWDTITVDHSIF
jgi:hypothetical protein